MPARKTAELLLQVGRLVQAAGYDGTASQAIKALEAGGYSVRQPSKVDGRSISLQLTGKGKKVLARDPFEVWCVP